MSSTMWGADADALDAVAAQVRSSGRGLEGSQARLGRSIHASPWNGPNADRFRQRWDGEYRRSMLEASSFLDGAGDALERNADQQRAASSGAGVGAGIAGAIIGIGAAGRDPMAEAYVETRKGMEDDLARARAELAELREKREHVGGIGNAIGNLNPADESNSEKYDRQIRERMATIERLEALLEDPTRQFLKVDASGDGRIIEVYGNLGTADHVAIHVPGMNTDIDSYLDRDGHSDAYALYQGLKRSAGDPSGHSVAVVSFLDYDAPGDSHVSGTDWPGALAEAASERRATAGAATLRDLVGDLEGRGVDPANVSIVAHSYGSVLTGIAIEDGLEVGRVVVIGSPGLGDGVDDISDLGTDVEIWAGRGGEDRIWVAPYHGEDPTDDGFGANVFDAGSVDHSHYYGGRTLERMSDIVVSGAPRR